MQSQNHNGPQAVTRRCFIPQDGMANCDSSIRVPNLCGTEVRIGVGEMVSRPGRAKGK